jgi:tRNA (guanosine-2'-O-)-methyltransferase
LDRGNTLRHPACVHWTGRDPVAWLSRQRELGSWIVGVELADEAIRLADLTAARERTIVVLGHEHDVTDAPPSRLVLAWNEQDRRPLVASFVAAALAGSRG